jgi:hypothetical protein
MVKIICRSMLIATECEFCCNDLNFGKPKQIDYPKTKSEIVIAKD